MYDHARQTSLTGTLRDEHAVILRALVLLERLGQGLEAGRPVDRKLLTWLRDFFGSFADRCHHGKEEQVLFPALEQYGIPRERGPIGVMLDEHEEGRGFLQSMTQGDDRKTAEAIRGYTALLRAHIDKENNVLFPLAEQVLPQAEHERLLHEFEAVEHAVAGPDVHERILSELAKWS